MSTNVLLALLGSVMLIGGGGALASQKFIVTNHTGGTCKVVFRALGCAGVKYDYLIVCKSAKIKNGRRASYIFQQWESDRQIEGFCKVGKKHIQLKQCRGSSDPQYCNYWPGGKLR